MSSPEFDGGDDGEVDPDDGRGGDAASLALAAVGVALGTAAVAWHLGVEQQALGRSAGPALALVVDGLSPLALVYGGYRLSRSAIPPAHRWVVVHRCLVGCGVVLVAIGATIAIRLFEGRTVAEPVFVLLVAADVGALAGTAAGYYEARARSDADRAERAVERSERVRYALGFVNRLLRHDIRNGITVVRGRVGTLDPHDPDPERVDEVVDVVGRQSARMGDLVEETGAVAEALLGEADDARVDLTEVVADALDTVDTKDAIVVTDLPESAPVAANAALRPVVANLVENAVDHGVPPDWDPADLRVETSVEVGDEAVRLRVTDDSVGMSDDQKATAFEPRAGTTHGGGLHLVSTLVDRFDGSIRVADGPDGGTAFEVRLPAADGSD